MNKFVLIAFFVTVASLVGGEALAVDLNMCHNKGVLGNCPGASAPTTEYITVDEIGFKGSGTDSGEESSTSTATDGTESPSAKDEGKAGDPDAKTEEQKKEEKKEEDKRQQECADAKAADKKASTEETKAKVVDKCHQVQYDRKNPVSLATKPLATKASAAAGAANAAAAAVQNAVSQAAQPTTSVFGANADLTAAVTRDSVVQNVMNSVAAQAVGAFTNALTPSAAQAAQPVFTNMANTQPATTQTVTTQTVTTQATETAAATTAETASAAKTDKATQDLLKATDGGIRQLTAADVTKVTGLKGDRAQNVATLVNAYAQSQNENTEFGKLLKEKGITLSADDMAYATIRAGLETALRSGTSSVTKSGRVDRGTFNHSSPDHLAMTANMLGVTVDQLLASDELQAQGTLLVAHKDLSFADSKVAKAGTSYAALGMSRLQYAYSINTTGEGLTPQTAAKTWANPVRGHHDYVWNWNSNVQSYANIANKVITAYTGGAGATVDIASLGSAALGKITNAGGATVSNAIAAALGGNTGAANALTSALGLTGGGTQANLSQIIANAVAGKLVSSLFGGSGTDVNGSSSGSSNTSTTKSLTTTEVVYDKDNGLTSTIMKYDNGSIDVALSLDDGVTTLSTTQIASSSAVRAITSACNSTTPESQDALMLMVTKCQG